MFILIDHDGYLGTNGVPHNLRVLACGTKSQSLPIKTAKLCKPNPTITLTLIDGTNNWAPNYKNEAHNKLEPIGFCSKSNDLVSSDKKNKSDKHENEECQDGKEVG